MIQTGKICPSVIYKYRHTSVTFSLPQYRLECYTGNETFLYLDFHDNFRTSATVNNSTTSPATIALKNQSTVSLRQIGRKANDVNQADSSFYGR